MTAGKNFGRRITHGVRRPLFLELAALYRLCVAPVYLRSREVILRPDLEGRERESRLEVLYDSHRQLEPVARLEVDTPAVEQDLYQLAEDVRSQEGDEVCNLVHAVRLVECTQLGKRRRSRGLTSGCGAAAAIRNRARQDFAEPAMQLGRIPATTLPRLQCGLEQCTQQRATQAARPRVDVTFRLFDEQVRRPALTDLHVLGRRAKREIPAPPPALVCVGDQEGGPALSTMLEEAERTTAHTFRGES